MPSADVDVVAATAMVQVGGSRAGSAVLVDERHLLTARHNVEPRSTRTSTPPDIRVVFPQFGDDGYGVTVLDLPNSAVDVAILQLADDKGVPARPIGVWAGRRLPAQVRVFGYPLAERAPTGVWRDFAVSGATTTGLQQLTWTSGAGTSRGHSGGPVVDMATCLLVGILSSGSVQGQFDRFVPVTVIESVWPGLRRPWLITGARSHVRLDGTAQRSHWRGGDGFMGRAEALDAIERWLAAVPGQGRPLLITGQPGAGKSAVLARAVLNLEATSSSSGVIFHARGGNATDFLDAVAAALGAPPSAGRGIGDLLDWLDHQQVPPGRLAVIVDALDEAENAQERSLIATALVALARRPWINVVVGTRPLTAGNRYRPGSMLHTLGVHDSTAKSLIDLDVPPYSDPAALLQLTIALLSQQGAHHPGPAGCAWETYRANPELSKRLARIVAERADRNFLVAALTATRLSIAEDALDPSTPGFDTSTLPSTVEEAVDKYLAGLPDPEPTRVRSILTALAHARGAGVTDDLWLRFVAALGYSADRLTLDALRDSPAADFLLQSSTDGGEPVTRLYHQALVEQLLPTRSSPGDHQAILQAVLNVVDDAGGWSVAPSYPRVHAADHAVEAGRLVHLLDEPEFVVSADPARLTAAVATLPPAERTPIATMVLMHGVQASTLPPDARRWFFAMTATHLGSPHLRDAFLANDPAFVRPCWAHSLGPPHQRLTHTAGVAIVLAVGRLDGRDVIVSGSLFTLQIWDAAGNPIGDPLTGHTGDWNRRTGRNDVVTALAIGRLDGRDVIVSGSDDGTLRIWDAAGKTVRDPLTGHTSGVNAVAVGRLNGRDIIVSGSYDGTLRFWNPAGPIGDPLIHSGGVTEMAIWRRQDRDVIVSGGNDRRLRIWDADGNPAGDPLIHPDGVSAMAVGRLNGRDIIVSGTDDGTVRIWDTAGRQVGEPLTGHTDVVHAVIVGRLNGRDVIISGSEDGAVRVWDAAGRPVGGPLTGHTGGVTSVAVGLANRDVVISGSRDGTVRIWHFAGSPVGHPRTGHTGPVRALAVGQLDGREVIVSGSHDGTVRVWDTAGNPTGQSFIRTSRWVSSVGIGQLHGRGVIVSEVIGGLQVWDASGDSVSDQIRFSSGVKAMAVGRLDDRDLIITAGNFEPLQIWDTAGKRIGRPLTRHPGDVCCVAVGRLNDRDVFVSGSESGAVQVWDSAGDPVGDPLTGPRLLWGGVVTIGHLDDRDVIIVGSRDDGALWIWDAAGRPVGDPLIHPGGVSGVACGRLYDREVIVSSGRSDGTLRVWDTAGRQLQGPIHLVEPCTGLQLSRKGLTIATGNAIAFLEANRKHG